MAKKLLEIYKNKLRPRFQKIFIALIIFFGVFPLFGFFGGGPGEPGFSTGHEGERYHPKIRAG
jgi:hypothetical protein